MVNKNHEQDEHLDDIVLDQDMPIVYDDVLDCVYDAFSCYLVVRKMAPNPSSRMVSITGIFYAPTILNFILGVVVSVIYMPNFMKARQPMSAALAPTPPVSKST